MLGEEQAAYAAQFLRVATGRERALAGLAGRCLMTGVTDLATFAERDAGTCVYQDVEGNQFWATIEGATAGDGAPVQGTVTCTSGTERFAGASGEGTYETTFSASPGAGMYQGTGSKRGTLLLPGNCPAPGGAHTSRSAPWTAVKNSPTCRPSTSAWCT